MGHGALLRGELRRLRAGRHGRRTSATAGRSTATTPTRPDKEYDPVAYAKYGWVCEHDPYNPDDRPRKHTALGRFRHENTAFRHVPGKPFVLYMGDDKANEGFYKFVSKRRFKPGEKHGATTARSSRSGTLYIARFDPDGRRKFTNVGDVVPTNRHEGHGQVGRGARVRARTTPRRSCARASAPSTTPTSPSTAREDVEVAEDGSVYLAMTNNSSVNDSHGAVRVIREHGNDPTASSFKWEDFAAGGPPSGGGGGFSSPDNLTFDGDGNLWVVTDISSSRLNLANEYQYHGNNAMFMVPTAGPNAGVALPLREHAGRVRGHRAVLHARLRDPVPLRPAPGRGDGHEGGLRVRRPVDLHLLVAERQPHEGPAPLHAAALRPRDHAREALTHPDASGRDAWPEASLPALKLHGRPVDVIHVHPTPEPEPDPPRAEAAALEPAALLDALFDQSGVGVTVVDSDLRIVRANNVHGVFGSLTPAELAGRPIADVLPELASQIVPAIRRVLETGEPAGVQEVVAPDAADPGKSRHFRTFRCPVIAADGSITGVATTVVDITDLRNAQAAHDDGLARQRESDLAELASRRAEAEASFRYRTIFEGASIGIIRVDRTGHVVEVNPALEQMLGYSAAELAVMTFQAYTHPDDIAENLAHFHESMTGPRHAYQFEKRCFRKDGEMIWVRVTSSAERDADGERNYAITMLEDITERKLAEQTHREQAELNEHQATHDALTGLANRRKLYADVDRALREPDGQ